MPSIHAITSFLLASNTYLLDAGPGCVVIIDPGDPDISNVTDHLRCNDKKNIKVLLTHEHADHCAGLNALYSFQPFELFCTRIVAEAIVDEKRNLSKYLVIKNPFRVTLPVTFVNDMESICIFDRDFMFIETPGHSPGSCCILLNEVVFTGDTILNNTDTPLNLPGGDKSQYLQSVQKIKKHVHKGMMIYPGHGSPFQVTSTLTDAWKH